MALLLLLVAVPFAAALTHFTYVEDLTPLMQSTHPATDAFIKLGDTFGQDLSTPVRLPNADLLRASMGLKAQGYYGVEGGAIIRVGVLLASHGPPQPSPTITPHPSPLPRPSP
eukprot:scaffold28621_cov107-Isochrysis_galbana.AAC.1